MRCIVCSSVLVPTELESHLLAHQCQVCGGTWVESNNYLAWLKEYGPVPPEMPEEQAESLPVEDVDKAKLCPTCGHMLLKYRVAHGIGFKLDRCGNCNGVWFDKNEWEALKSRNLHDEVNSFFTTPWQNEVQQEERRKRFQGIYTERFGTADYAELQRVRTWIEKHPQRAALLAYLMDQDPYSV